MLLICRRCSFQVEAGAIKQSDVLVRDKSAVLRHEIRHNLKQSGLLCKSLIRGIINH